ncbi:hypothetical protein [Clostridium beijerinckii]|uniref:hypothetical protein n=1 Tax=Clostridium beijerinckii TaxID=1520 RepID=UPI001361CE6B|nr:hypothetical protein [Clostridium beijerinckii]MZK53463.1 hypothetical protein [Clostridium beijerinckii]MZK61601.1 hypothetical protein [Clostridium beijerinckii]MZK71887.1 hypothetical protein [Clostridium beijerinckii]MZK77230.1 hypothetical protein [Clostridium beijerinckii]MZK86858.1 hypothetical protein [Clostridium beijerinckii]
MNAVRNYIDKIKNEYTISEKLFLILDIILIAITIYAIYVGGPLYFTSDGATANLLAREQITTKQLFPSEWVYLQDVWVLTLNILIIPLSIFTKNQMILRSTAVLIQTIILVITLVVFSSRILKNKSYLLYIAIFFSGISSMYMENIFFQAAYGTVFIITILLYMLGNESIDHNLKINKKIIIVFLILVIVCCISGVRYIGTFVAPFCVSIFLTYILENYKQNKDEAIKSLFDLGRFLIPLSIACIVGVIIFKEIISNGNYVQGWSKPILVDYNNIYTCGKSTINVIQGILINFGYMGGVDLLSIKGVFNIFKLLCVIPVMFIIPYIITRKFETNSTNINRLIIFYWSLFIINIIMCIVCNLNDDTAAASRYFQSITLIAFMLICNYIYEKINCNKLFWETTVYIVSILCFVVVGIHSLIYVVGDYKERMKPTNELIETLRERNLKFGYATYWNAYRNSVLANFEPEILAVTDQNVKPMMAGYNLSSKRTFRSDYYNGETFLLLTDKEYELCNEDENLYKQFGKPKDFMEVEGYKILIYDYNISNKLPNVSIGIGSLVDIKKSMKFNEYVDKNDNPNINIYKNGILYGPYISLDKGKYQIKIDCDYDDTNNMQALRVTSDYGKKEIYKENIKKGNNIIDFDVKEDSKNVEFIFNNESLDTVQIKSIQLERVG